MKGKLTTILLFSSLLSLQGEELIKYKKLGEYENVTVTKVQPHRITIRTGTGALRSLKFNAIPEHVRADLGMTLEEAKEHSYREDAGLEAHRLALVKSKELKEKAKLIKDKKLSIDRGVVTSVLSKGILVRTNLVSKPNEAYSKKHLLTNQLINRGLASKVTVYVETDTKGYVDGSSVSNLIIYKAGNFTYSSAFGEVTVPKYSTNHSIVLNEGN